MDFDTDRFAKLAGLPSSKTHSPAPKAPDRSEHAVRSVMTESHSRKSSDHIHESAEIKKLRSIIRREALSVLKQMNESKLAVRDTDLLKAQKRKSLTEAVTMGFYGPGFGGKSFVLGGPMTSASGFASLVESPLDEDAAEDEEGTLKAHKADDPSDV